MTCHQCTKKLLESQFMEIFENSVPLLYDNSVDQPRGENGFLRKMIENRPGNPNRKQPKPSALTQTFDKSVPLLYDCSVDQPRGNNGFSHMRSGNPNQKKNQPYASTIQAESFSRYLPTIQVERSSMYALP
jgi:hypothetical protein